VSLIQQDDSNPGYTRWNIGDAYVYLAKDEYQMVWFEGWNQIEILKEYDLLEFVELLSRVNAERQLRAAKGGA
jgi:hypothetical protein